MVRTDEPQDLSFLIFTLFRSLYNVLRTASSVAPSEQVGSSWDKQRDDVNAREDQCQHQRHAYDHHEAHGSPFVLETDYPSRSWSGLP